MQRTVFAALALALGMSIPLSAMAQNCEPERQAAIAEAPNRAAMERDLAPTAQDGAFRSEVFGMVAMSRFDEGSRRAVAPQVLQAFVAELESRLQRAPNTSSSAYQRWEICYARAWMARSQAPPPSAPPPPAPRPAAAAPPVTVASNPRPAPPRPAASPMELMAREGGAALDEVLAELAQKGTPPPRPNLARNEEDGQDASSCLELRANGGPSDDDILFNTCSYPVEALWCVEGVDCRPDYSNMQTLNAGGSYRMGGSADGLGRTVHWGACRGRNSIRRGGEAFMHVCTKAPS